MFKCPQCGSKRYIEWEENPIPNTWIDSGFEYLVGPRWKQIIFGPSFIVYSDMYLEIVRRDSAARFLICPNCECAVS